MFNSESILAAFLKNLLGFWVKKGASNKFIPLSRKVLKNKEVHFYPKKRLQCLSDTQGKESEYIHFIGTKRKNLRKDIIS